MLHAASSARLTRACTIPPCLSLSLFTNTSRYTPSPPPCDPWQKTAPHPPTLFPGPSCLQAGAWVQGNSGSLSLPKPDRPSGRSVSHGACTHALERIHMASPLSCAAYQTGNSDPRLCVSSVPVKSLTLGDGGARSLVGIGPPTQDTGLEGSGDSHSPPNAPTPSFQQGCSPCASESVATRCTDSPSGKLGWCQGGAWSWLHPGLPGLPKAGLASRGLRGCPVQVPTLCSFSPRCIPYPLCLDCPGRRNPHFLPGDLTGPVHEGRQHQRLEHLPPVQR